MDKWFLVGNCSDGSFAVYQCVGRIGHDGGPIIAQFVTKEAAADLAVELNHATKVMDLSKPLPQFKIGA